MPCPLPSCFRTIIPLVPFQVYFDDYGFLKLSRLHRWLSGKESTCQCRRHRRHCFNSWVGTSPGERNDNPLKYPCLEDPVDRGAWWAIIHGVAESDMTELSSVQFSSVAQSCLILCDAMNRSMPGLPVPPTPGVHSDSRSSSQWCHPAISSSVVPFSSCP